MKKLCITLTLLLTFSLLLSSCSDYTYEPQQLFPDEDRYVAEFKTFYVVKTLYEAAGKGEDEFNRVYAEMDSQYHNGESESYYEYYASTGKCRDEFLTAYNVFKDIKILATKDAFFTDRSVWLYNYYYPNLIDQNQIKCVYYAVDADRTLTFICHEPTPPPELEDTLFTYKGETFTADISITDKTKLYDERGKLEYEINYGEIIEFFIHIYDLAGMTVGYVRFSQHDFLLSLSDWEERITRWLDHFYLAPFHEVVQNAKAP